MAQGDSDFWPSELNAGVLSPLEILVPRASELTAVTKSRLQGRVRSTESSDKATVFHTLEVVVPALKNYSHEILTIWHSMDMYYPCFVEAECFPKRFSYLGKIAELYEPQQENEANSDEELMEILRRAIRSREIKALLFSLVARANEATVRQGLESATAFTRRFRVTVSTKDATRADALLEEVQKWKEEIIKKFDYIKSIDLDPVSFAEHHRKTGAGFAAKITGQMKFASQPEYNEITEYSRRSLSQDFEFYDPL